MSFVSNLKKDNKLVSLTVCFFAYIIALGIAIGVGYGLRN